MDITLETVGSVDRRERLLQKRGLMPRVTVTLEFTEVLAIEEALRGADYQHCDADLSLAPVTDLQRELAKLIV